MADPLAISTAILAFVGVITQIFNFASDITFAGQDERAALSNLRHESEYLRKHITMLDQLELRDIQNDSSNAQLVTYLHESRREMEKLISLLEDQRLSLMKRYLRRLR